jgi:hypothetical protein
VSSQALDYVRSARQARLDEWMVAEKAPEGSRDARFFLEEVIASHAEKPLITRQLLGEDI